MRKLDTRGGKRPKKEAVSGQAKLLDLIWELTGGAAAVATKINVHRQLPVNWRNRGKVPLELVGRLSRALKLPPEAFNYEEVIDFKGEGLTWEQTVKAVETLYEAENKIEAILKVPPRSKKEILL